MTVFDVDIVALTGGSALHFALGVPPDDPQPAGAIEKLLPR